MARRTENDVPILALASESSDFVDERHKAALEAAQEGSYEHHLTGARVWVHNPQPINSPDTPDVTEFLIGGSTLHEALTEVVGAYEQHAAVERPDFVASTDEHIGRLLAEHFGCEELSAEQAHEKMTELRGEL